MGLIKRKVEKTIKQLVQDKDLTEAVDAYIRDRIKVVLKDILRGLDENN